MIISWRALIVQIMSVEFKRTTILLLTSLLFATSPFAQDTFSIVAIDSVTGEVGSAGASCVDLSRTSLNMDDFIGVLFPGKGAINSQASYIPVNQNNATEQMNQGNKNSIFLALPVNKCEYFNELPL